MKTTAIKDRSVCCLETLAAWILTVSPQEKKRKRKLDRRCIRNVHNQTLLWVTNACLRRGCQYLPSANTTYRFMHVSSYPFLPTTIFLSQAVIWNSRLTVWETRDLEGAFRTALVYYSKIVSELLSFLPSQYTVDSDIKRGRTYPRPQMTAYCQC